MVCRSARVIIMIEVETIEKVSFIARAWFPLSPLHPFRVLNANAEHSPLFFLPKKSSSLSLIDGTMP